MNIDVASWQDINVFLHHFGIEQKRSMNSQVFFYVSSFHSFGIESKDKIVFKRRSKQNSVIPFWNRNGMKAIISEKKTNISQSCDWSSKAQSDLFILALYSVRTPLIVKGNKSLYWVWSKWGSQWWGFGKLFNVLQSPIG